MRILFIVTSFNDAPYIRAALVSILKQRGNHEKKIIVVDDNSQDNSRKIVRSLAKKYREIQLIRQEHQGQAAALNRGLREAQAYGFVALVESDIQIEKTWLLKNLQKFTGSQIAAVGGILSPFHTDSLIAQITGYEVEYKMRKQKSNPIHLTSANIIYRSSVFAHDPAPFQEKLVNAAFDNEFNLRLVKSGYKMVLNKEARAFHHYKPKLVSFLKRVWAYTYYRPYLKNRASYPYDNVIRIQIILILLLLVSIIFQLPPESYQLLIIIYLISTLPPVLWTIKNKNNLIMLVYPLISLLRNLTALLAIISGSLNYYLLKISKKQK